MLHCTVPGKSTGKRREGEGVRRVRIQLCSIFRLKYVNSAKEINHFSFAFCFQLYLRWNSLSTCVFSRQSVVYMPETAIVLSTQFLQASSIYSQEKTNLANTIFEGKRCPAWPGPPGGTYRSVYRVSSKPLLCKCHLKSNWIWLQMVVETLRVRQGGDSNTHIHKFDQVSTLHCSRIEGREGILEANHSYNRGYHFSSRLTVTLNLCLI